MSLSIEESTPVPESPVAEGLAVRVRGLVQGVGFRPHVARLAQALGVDGDVCNDGEGVLIHLWATAAVRAAFLARLEDEAPPLARIEAVETWPLHDTPPHGFSIRTSEHGAVRTGVVPDAATCDACLRELFDPADRRYRYPFINCTHCGPRLSIQRQVPYDRAGTSMAGFVMCDACRREYEDAGDRRYHAQPNACPVCGPRVWLEPTAGNTALEGEDAVAAAATWLRQGAILAVKGLGGFHLACDAANAAAVNRLRAAKRRYAKPFALMARDPGVIRRYADCDAIEAGLLASPAAPIVLLNAREDAALPEGIAPGQDALGFMLPYTPLHHLLLAGFETPLVMTSGNLSDEPQCIDNDEARERLSPLVDGLLLHDRDIVNRVDDSVVRVVTGKARLLRRARGYVPAPLPLPPGFEQAPPVLALGGELKSTFCLFKEGQAILSPHLGDLEDARVLAAYEEVLDRFQGLFDFRPACLAGDAHPGYLSTQLGRDRAGRDGLTFTPVQHHHAHIAACLAENGWSLNAGPVLGIALDGLGYGEDATLWGGEFLRADYRAMHRLAALQPVALPGGVRAILEPWRLTYAQLVRLPDWSELRERYASLDLLQRLQAKPLSTLDAMLEKGINAPLSSACGRLFDAVAAALGICFDVIHYEGQAAIELEVLARRVGNEPGGYPFARIDGDPPRLDPAPMWAALLADLASGVSRECIAWRFHAGLLDALAALAGELAAAQHLDTVALSGGVFQNRLMLAGLQDRLERLGLRVLTHAQVPSNDGGVALGQAVIAAAQLLEAQGS